MLDSASSADYQLTLETQVTELYGDYTPGQPAAAVIAARFFVVDAGSGRYNVLLQRDYRQTERIVGDGPDALVRAWQQACRRMFLALTEDLRRLPAAAEVVAAGGNGKP